MRNIKSSLRFVRNSALLFVAASGVTYLTGCQSENDITPETPTNVPESTLKTAAYSVYGANQGRVINYGSKGTRAGEYVEATETFVMPACPTIPADAKNILDKKDPTNEYSANYLNNGTIEAGVYFISESDEIKSGINMQGGVTLYVAGKLSIDWQNGNGENTIYVMPGGEVIFPSALVPGTTLYNYGEVGGNLTVGENSKMYSETDIIGCEEFGVNNGAEFKSKGSISAKTIRLNGEIVACAFIAENELTLNGTGTIRTSYLKAKTLTLNASNVILDNNGLVEAERLNVSGEATRFTVEGTNAVVGAKELNTNNLTWPKQVFDAKIAIDVDKYMIAENSTKWDGTEYKKSDFEFQVSSEEQVIWVPATKCHGSYGENPNKPGEENPDEPITTPEIKKITDIESLDDEINHGDHDHGIISATCITFGADGTAYASYHLRGNGKDANKNPNYIGEYAQKGCIEVIKDNGDAGMELGSYMIAPDWDFNHLIVDGNRIVTVGNSKTMSAFIGTLPVTFAASATADRDDFQVRELTTNEPIYGTSDKTGEQIKIGFKNAGDGNCVVRQGNYYYVATYEGYGPLTLDFGRVNDADGNKIFHSTPGSCKHISIDGTNMAVIAHDTYDKTRSTASVYTFGASDFSFANQLRKYDAVGTIEPVDGKNVIAMDGNEIYVCLSKGGLVRLSDGKKFQRGTNGQVPVNGMAFDEKYIYVANGSFVSVLDKATMEEICYYHAASQKSANYIALRNGKIYVAFGEDGIQVFQLVEKEIAMN